MILKRLGRFVATLVRGARSDEPDPPVPLPSFGSELRRLRSLRGIDDETLFHAEPYLFANSPDPLDRLDALESDVDDPRSVPELDLRRLERLLDDGGALRRLASMPERTLRRRQAADGTLDVMSDAFKRS